MTSPQTEGAGPATTPRTRARARHILDHYYIGPSRNPDVLEIWGYSPEMSYVAGDMVDLHVSTTADTWSLEICRDGAEYEQVLLVEDLPGVHQDTPEDCSVKGCDWSKSYSFKLPHDWSPGGYLVTLRAARGQDQVEEHHLFFVRSTPEAPNRYALICATGTWLAYNCWGGSNHYEGITGPNRDQCAPVVSTQRPWTRGFCRLPVGAPRAVPETPPKPGDMVRYPYMEWAYAYGYSKKYASAGWASYERQFARWAERQGYGLDFFTQHDLHRDPDLLGAYECVIIVGHDEYWTGEMRDTIDAFVEQGGKVARFAGNFLWQTRLEDEGRTQVCYKYAADDRDPVAGTARASLLTGAWDSPQVGRPGAKTFGANGYSGVYAGLGHCVGGGSGGFTVYRPGHWSLKDCHLGYGDVLGAGARIFGYEVDGLDYRFEDGLPFPTGNDGAAADVEIIAMGLATNIEADHQVWGETRYIGGDEAAFKAAMNFGAVTETTIDAASRGNGVIIHWARGKGEIFNAATCEWVMGLTRGDPQVEQVTRNVLNRFAGPNSEC